MKFTITFLSIFFYKTIDTLNDFSCIKLQLECFTKTYCRLPLLYRLPSSTSFFNCINREQICNQDQSRVFNFFIRIQLKGCLRTNGQKKGKKVQRERESDAAGRERTDTGPGFRLDLELDPVAAGLGSVLIRTRKVAPGVIATSGTSRLS